MDDAHGSLEWPPMLRAGHARNWQDADRTCCRLADQDNQHEPSGGNLNHVQTIAAALAFGMALAAPAYASQQVDHVTAALSANPAFLELSKRYTEEVKAQKPEAAMILEKLDLQYLHQLDPSKVYRLNVRTGNVTVEDAALMQAKGSASPTAIGFASNTASIVPGPDTILGQARTVVTCPFAGQFAEVAGFMASTVSRDPVGGIKNGFIYADDFLTTGAQVNFSILKLPRGARNPANRTVMETTHSGSCGEDAMLQNLVSTWPPLRIEMAIDDTGSMSGELAGLKSAVSGFIASQDQKRGVSYELISFKDSPSLRLANTTDTNAAIAAVQSLFPSGGADCPEDSVGALNMALNGAESDEDSESAIVLVTDASPHSGDVGSIIARAQAAGVKVHVMLSGDCVGTASSVAPLNEQGPATSAVSPAAVSARAVFERIATETGGLYYYAPNASASDYAAILTEIFNTALTGGDDEPPVVTVRANPGALWPVNHKLIPIAIELSVVDNKDPNPQVELESVTSSEPDNGQGDGNTSGDIQIGANGAIALRAERNGAGTDRIYTITYRATDASGNVGTGSAQVVVPHRAPR